MENTELYTVNMYDELKSPTPPPPTPSPVITNKEKNKGKLLTIEEYTSIVNTNNTTEEQTIQLLNSTLGNNEPRKGSWLINEKGEDIYEYDSIDLNNKHVTRPRGLYAWNKAIDTIIEKYAPEVDIASEAERMREYEALRIMDESYLKGFVVEDQDHLKIEEQEI